MDRTLLSGIAVTVGTALYLVMFAWVAGRAWEAADDWKLYRSWGGIDPKSGELISDRDERWWERRWHVRSLVVFVTYIPLSFTAWALAFEPYPPYLKLLGGIPFLVVPLLLRRSTYRTRNIESPRPAVPAGYVAPWPEAARPPHRV